MAMVDSSRAAGATVNDSTGGTHLGMIAVLPMRGGRSNPMNVDHLWIGGMIAAFIEDARRLFEIIQTG